MIMKLGIVVSQKGEFNHENVTEAFQLVAQSGATITRHYLSWTDIETAPGVYTFSDYMINQARDAGLKLSVAFHTIRTGIVGPRPADMVGLAWDDPLLIERFSTMVLAFLNRYEDVVDYLELGSEVNGYLEWHSEEVEPYRTFLIAVRNAVKMQHPTVQVGVVFAYRALKDGAAWSIYSRLSVGDFDGFTLYVYGDNFAHNKTPRRVLNELREIEALTGNRQYAIEELGWTTSKMLSGSECNQRRAVKYAFQFVNQADARLEFLTWFNLHDGQKPTCDQMARSFFPPGSDPDPDDLALFSEFLCNFGLRRNDGTPKLAWDEWVKGP